MDINFSGKIIEVGELRTIQVQGTPRYILTFVAQYDLHTDWPKSVELEYFGKQPPKALEEGALRVGAYVQCKMSVESRKSEKHNRWFTTAKAFGISCTQGEAVSFEQAKATHEAAQESIEDAIPF